jgi:flagellar biosynthesis/type III secretory pathway M-ring protein FliF/YscJ
MLKEGKSGAEIRRVLNERSGLNLTGTPESSIGWMLPVGLLVGAVGLLALVVVRFRKGADEGSQGASTDAAHDEDDDDDDDDDDDELEGADDEADPGDTDDDEASDDDELEARLRRELEDDDDANV